MGYLEGCPRLPTPLRLSSLAPPGIPGALGSLVPSLLLQALFSSVSPLSKLCFPSSTSSPAPLKATQPLPHWFLREESPGSESNHSPRENGHAVHRLPHSAPGGLRFGLRGGKAMEKGAPAWHAASLLPLLSCSRPKCGPPLLSQLRYSLTVGSPERLGGEGFPGSILPFLQRLHPQKSKWMCSQKTQPRWKCLPFSLLSVIFSIFEVRFPAILGEYREEEGPGSSAQRGAVITRPLISGLFLPNCGKAL